MDQRRRLPGEQHELMSAPLQDGLHELRTGLRGFDGVRIGFELVGERCGSPRGANGVPICGIVNGGITRSACTTLTASAASAATMRSFHA